MSLLKRAILFPTVVLTTSLLVLLSSCVSDVSQREYDQLRADLAEASAKLEQAKKELAAAKQGKMAMQEKLQSVKSAWQALEPEVEWAALVSENSRDYHLWQAGKMTWDEYIAQSKEFLREHEVCRQEIGNEEIIQKFAAYWEASGDDQARIWNEMYEI